MRKTNLLIIAVGLTAGFILIGQNYALAQVAGQPCTDPTGGKGIYVKEGGGVVCFPFITTLLNIPCQAAGGCPEDLTNPAGIISFIYRLAVGLGAAVAVGSIIIGGFQYTYSAANPSLQGEAKDRIVSAVIGLALLIGAVFILNTINPALTVAGINLQQRVITSKSRLENLLGTAKFEVGEDSDTIYARIGSGECTSRWAHYDDKCTDLINIRRCSKQPDALSCTMRTGTIDTIKLRMCEDPTSSYCAQFNTWFQALCTQMTARKHRDCPAATAAPSGSSPLGP